MTVIRRFSWILPRKDNPKFRKDITEGTEGIIEGYADPEMRHVLLKVDLNVNGKKQSVTQQAYPRNLQLTSEYLLQKAGETVAASESAASGSGEPKPENSLKEHLKGFTWVQGSSDPADVKVEDPWKSLLADGDALAHVPEGSHCCWPGILVRSPS